MDQLKRETKRCLELTHPHIVRIHDFVHDDRSGCISIEYIDGETLSNLRAEKEHRLGWVSAVDSKGRTIWITDAHRDGKRYVVRADEMLTVFVELK